MEDSQNSRNTELKNSQIEALKLNFTDRRKANRDIRVYEYYKQHGWGKTRDAFRIGKHDLNVIIHKLKPTSKYLSTPPVCFGHKTEPYYENELDYATPKPTRHGYNPFDT